MRADPTPAQLRAAYAACHLSISLDAALSNPTVALALRNTALALSGHRPKPKPSSPHDFKCLAAGDKD